MEVVQQDRCRSSLNRKARRKSKMKILKKLKPEERGLTRTLWEQVFTEDTKEFLDYYYTEKTKNNEIYVIETDHDIRAMMQLNPYVIQMGKKAVESRYIVAVATEPLYRHRGYMAELLSKTARDLYQQKMPFFFLMPASEKIYYPHNYRFIYAADVWSAKGTDGKELTIQKIVELQNDSGVRLRKAEEKDCKKLGDFAEEVLKKLIPKSETVTPQNIIKKVSTFYNISESDITGKVKTKEIVVPRQISMYLCRKILNMNDTNIGKEFGKDRTTVGHNIEKIEESIDTNSTIKSDVNYILKDLNYNEG